MGKFTEEPKYNLETGDISKKRLTKYFEYRIHSKYLRVISNRVTTLFESENHIELIQNDLKLFS